MHAAASGGDDTADEARRRRELEAQFSRYKTPGRVARSKFFLIPGVRELVVWCSTSSAAALQVLRRVAGGASAGMGIPAYQLLLVLNVLVFLLQSTVFPTLMVACARINSLILASDQVHRLATPMFLHGDLRHLLFNSLSLANIGPTVESLYGTKRFWLIYLGSGVAGNLMGLEYGGPRPSVGASGAIFGLIGAMVAWLRRTQELNLSVSSAVSRSLLMTVVFGLLPHGRVDQWAHLGGLLGGVVLAALFAPWRWGSRRNIGSGRGYVIETTDERPFVPEWAATAALSVLALAVSWACWSGVDYAINLNQARQFGRETFRRILTQPPRRPGLWRYF